MTLGDQDHRTTIVGRCAQLWGSRPTARTRKVKNPGGSGLYILRRRATVYTSASPAILVSRFALYPNSRVKDDPNAYEIHQSREDTPAYPKKSHSLRDAKSSGRSLFLVAWCNRLVKNVSTRTRSKGSSRGRGPRPHSVILTRETPRDNFSRGPTRIRR